VLAGYQLQSRTDGPGLGVQGRLNKCPTEASVSLTRDKGGGGGRRCCVFVCLFCGTVV
jgi:hypothetical protein